MNKRDIKISFKKQKKLMNRILSKNIFQKLSFIQWNKNHLHIHIHTNKNISCKKTCG